MILGCLWDADEGLNADGYGLEFDEFCESEYDYYFWLKESE